MKNDTKIQGYKDDITTTWKVTISLKEHTKGELYHCIYQIFRFKIPCSNNEETYVLVQEFYVKTLKKQSYDNLRKRIFHLRNNGTIERLIILIGSCTFDTWYPLHLIHYSKKLQNSV